MFMNKKQVLSSILIISLLMRSIFTGISAEASQEPWNVALNREKVYVSTSSESAHLLVDGDSGTYAEHYISEWCVNPAKSQYVAVDLETAYEVSSVILHTPYNQGLPEKFQVLAFDGVQWMTVYEGIAPDDSSDIAQANVLTFEPIVCNAIKVVAETLSTFVDDQGNPGSDYVLRLVEMEVMGLERNDVILEPAIFGELPNIASSNETTAFTNTPWDDYMYTPSDEVGNGYGPQVLTNGELGYQVTYFSSNRSVDFQNTPITAELFFEESYQMNQISIYPAWSWNETEGDIYAGGFPEDFVISIWDGSQWVDVVTVTDYTAPQMVDPQVFHFADIIGNAVKITSLKNSLADGEYALCLSEIAVHGVPFSEQVNDGWNIRDISLIDGYYGYWGDNNYLGIGDGTLENGTFSTIFRLDWLEDAIPDNEQPAYMSLYLGDLNAGNALVFQMSDITGGRIDMHWLQNDSSVVHKELYAEKVGLSSFYQSDIRMDVRFRSDTAGTDIYVYFNGIAYGWETVHIEYDMSSVERNIWIERYETEALLYLAAPTDLAIAEQKTLTPQAYDLSEGSYLLTGHNLTVDGKSKDSGSVLDAPGDYTVVKTDGDIQYTQKISLYRIGDVDSNGTRGDRDDFVALKELVATEKYASELSTAESFAGDLNNDEKLSLADVDLMDEIVACENAEAQNNKLNEIIEMHSAPSLSFGYLGGDTVMPIGGFWGPNRDESVNSVTSEVYQLLKDSGVNLITAAPYGLGTNPDSYSFASMRLAEEVGIGYLVLDPSLNPEWNSSADIGNEGAAVEVTDIAKQLGRYSYLDNFVGINVKDEPLPDQMKYYDGITQALNQYSNISGIMNAYPANVIKETGVSYADYLQSIKDAGVKTLLYDYYPFSWGADLGNSTIIIPEYFTSLNGVRTAAQSDGIPFWGYVAAGGDFRDKDDNGNAEHGETVIKEIPTAEETYWNVNTQLAFGAKGIAWFPLVQPTYYSLIDETTNDFDRNGIIGADNQTTPFYDYAKKMNTHIAAVDEVLMKAKSTGVMATGTETYAGYHLSRAGVNLLSGTDILKSVTSEAGNAYGALVGCFEYKNMEAFYVMNYDVTAGETQNIVLTLDKTRGYTIQSGDGGQDVNGTDNTIELSIGSGEAVLVVMWDESEPMVGDTDSDFNVTELDIPYLRSYLVGTHWCKAVVANINGDGVVDVRDLVRLKKQFMNQQE